jgi:hypothetical protein
VSGYSTCKLADRWFQESNDLNTPPCICHGWNVGRNLRALAVATVVTERRSGVIKWLDITARLAWIGAPFHFIRINPKGFVAPAAPPWGAGKIAAFEHYNPPAWIAAGALTR